MKPIDKSERYTLSKLVIERIKQYILERQLSPGDRLPSERDLCKQMNISRTILREALHALESAGILEIRHGEGNYVCDQFLSPLQHNLNFMLQMNGTDRQEMTQVRYLLESSAVDSLAGSSNVNWDELRSAAVCIRQTELTHSTYHDRNAEFHLHIVASIQNSSFTQLCKPFLLWLPCGLNKQNDEQTCYHEHLDYLSAIQDGDVKLAKERLKNHLGL